MQIIKLKNKFKLALTGMLTLVMVILCFVTACQPTPEKPVVVNKRDGELEKAIMQTAPPQTETLQDTAEPEQALHIKDTRINDAGTITVNIDADVILPGDEKITVARLGKYYYSQEEVNRIIQVFFDDDLKFYDPLVTTKADIEAAIMILQQRMTDEEAMLNCDYAVFEGITDLEDIKNHINQRIEELKKQWQEAPEYSTEIETINVESGIMVDVDYGGEYMGYATCPNPYARMNVIILHAFGDHIGSGRYLEPRTVTKLDVNSSDSEFTAAKQIVQNFIDEIGVEGVRIGDIYKSLDNTIGTLATFENAKEVVTSDREFYVFCIERIVGERTLDFTFYDGTLSEIDNDAPYERMEVWVEDDKMVKFSWLNCAEVTETVNDNVALQIDYEQALDTAVNQLFIEYAYMFDRERAESVTAEITAIEFEIVRIKEKDTNKYIVVPAWKIYGTGLC